MRMYYGHTASERIWVQGQINMRYRIFGIDQLGNEDHVDIEGETLEELLDLAEQARVTRDWKQCWSMELPF